MPAIPTARCENDADSRTVSIVVPTYREAENLDELVSRISRALDQLQWLYEILIVDDFSDDGTDRQVEALRSAGHAVRLIQRRGQRGLSSAVLTGFTQADSELLVCMDADLSHPPEAIPDLLRPLCQAHAEFVVGSRYVPGASTDERWSWFRKLNSRVATLLARPFTRLKDPLAGFFALPRDVFLRGSNWDPIGYKVGLEILVKANCRRVAEVPIHFADRRRGQSKLTLGEQCNYVRHLVRLAQFRLATWGQLVVFCVVGASGAVVDLLTLAALLRVGWALPGARAVAIATALCWNFLGNEFLTFRGATGVSPRGDDRAESRADSRGRLLRRGQRFLKFALACSLGALINYTTTLSVLHAVSLLKRHPLWAAALGIVVATGFNFLLSRTWVFRSSEGPAAAYPGTSSMDPDMADEPGRPMGFREWSSPRS